MIRNPLIAIALTALLGGCATGYGYREGAGDYYYGSPSVDYGYSDGYYGAPYSTIGYGGLGYGGIGYGSGWSGGIGYGYGGYGYGGYPFGYGGVPYYYVPRYRHRHDWHDHNHGPRGDHGHGRPGGPWRGDGGGHHGRPGSPGNPMPYPSQRQRQPMTPPSGPRPEGLRPQQRSRGGMSMQRPWDPSSRPGAIRSAPRVPSGTVPRMTPSAAERVGRPMNRPNFEARSRSMPQYRSVPDARPMRAPMPSRSAPAPRNRNIGQKEEL